MDEPLQIREYNFHSSIIILKRFIMNLIKNCKIVTSAICLAIVFLSACKGNNKEQQETSASHISKEYPHTESQLSDNEVKAEAPDATVKTEQGYALPRHTAQLAQSPINIILNKTVRDSKQQYSLSFHSDINAVENLGHTIQVDFKNGSTCAVNGKVYLSKQFHFHTPSEHLIDGQTFPMEMHIVNVFSDSVKPNKTSYVVLAILFKMGAENKFISKFLNKIPGKEGERNEIKTGEVRLDELIAQFAGNKIKSYYAYTGSLTTPPYSENVQWVLLKEVVEASEEQIIAIEKMEGNNARHIQAINDRKVYDQ